MRVPRSEQWELLPYNSCLISDASITPNVRRCGIGFGQQV